MCQDRMWQLDLFRRVSTGRVAELLGVSAYEIDKFVRNMKISKSANEDLKSLSNKTLDFGNAFIKGINDAAANTHLPLEYYLTNTNWSNFTLADSQAIIYFTSLSLSKIWGSDLIKVQLRKALGKIAETLIPSSKDFIKPKAFCVDNSELPEELKGPPEQLKDSDFGENLEYFAQVFEEGAGSNGWVISGKFTQSGKPIMSNDPHLSSSIPSLWYMTHITVGNYSQYGGNILGSPLTSIGRNNGFSWGTTSLKVDDIDIYAEKTLNSTHYQFGETVLEFSEFDEIIKVKGSIPITVTFRETIHGPLLENSIVGAKKIIPAFSGLPSKTLSIAWASIGAKDRSLDFIHRLPEIKDVHELRKEFTKATAIQIAVFGASSSGDIFIQSVGRLPIKQYKGDYVLPGWITETKWKGFVSPEDMPYTVNPKKGFIVTANNYLVDDEYKFFESLGSYYSQARAERITEVLEEFVRTGKKFTAEDQIEIMKDEIDVYARRSVPKLLKMVKNRTKYGKEVKEMEGWDFGMGVESRPAAVYAQWSIQMVKNLLKDRISEELLQFYLRSQIMHNNYYLFFTDYYTEISPLCDDPTTEKKETCEELVTKSFEQAVNLTENKPWGHLHQLTLKHLPFSQVPYLKWFFERTIPIGGWHSTVHPSYSDWNSTFIATQGPGFKFVCDLGNSSANYWSLETGTSGNVQSVHYDDMLKTMHYGNLPRFGFV